MPLARNDAGEYMYLAADGWKPAPRAVNPETKQEAVFDGKEWTPLNVVEGKRANDQAGFLDNAARTIARGATFGFADELAAGGNAAVGAVGDLVRGGGPGFQQRYNQNLEYERGRDKALDQSNPVASAIGQIGGGVAGAFAAPVIAPFGRATTLATVGNAAAGGAVGGALGGFGEGEGVGDRIQRAVTGGAVGATLGPLLMGVATAGEKVGRGIKNVLGMTDPDTTAQRLLARALARDAIPEDELARRAALSSDPQILADIAGRNTAGLSAITARIPSEAPEAAMGAMAIRRDARPDRIAAAVDTAMGGGAGDDVARIAQTLSDQRRVNAAPLYEKAFERPVTIRDARKVQRFVTDPIGQDALQVGMRDLEIEYMTQGRLFDPAKYGVTRSQNSGKWIIDPDILEGRQAPSFRLLDAVKRGYDEIVESFRDPTTGRMSFTRRAKLVDDARATYRNALADMNPAYRDALKAWSDPSQSLDALRRGQQALRVNRDTTASMTSRVSDEDLPFLQLGAGRAIADMTSDPARAAGAARRLVEDRQMQARLESVLPDPMRRDFLARALRRETDMARVDRLVDPGAGSQTMPLQALTDDIGNEPMLVRMLSASRNGGVTSALASGGLAAYRAGQGLKPAAADALAPMLFGQGPEAIKAALDAVNKRKIADAIAAELMSGRMQRAIAGGVGGGSVVAN